MTDSESEGAGTVGSRTFDPRMRRVAAIGAAITGVLVAAGLAWLLLRDDGPAFEFEAETYRVVVDRCGADGAVGWVENRTADELGLDVIITFLLPNGDLVHSTRQSVIATPDVQVPWAVPYQPALAGDSPDASKPQCRAEVVLVTD